MKTHGMDKFSQRLDEIFEQGNPTKAQILDAYNKAASLPSLTKERVIEVLRKYTHNYGDIGCEIDFENVAAALCSEPEKEEDRRTQIINLLIRGRRIEAIKTYKDYMGCGLQEAKYQVQLIDEGHSKKQSVEPDKTAEEILSKWMDKDMSYSKSALGAMNEFANQFKIK
jgi:ribosomal protein L7/L12